MSAFVIDMATAEDVGCLGHRLRVADVEEIRAASGLAPDAVLRRSYSFSTHVWAVRTLSGHGNWRRGGRISHLSPVG